MKKRGKGKRGFFIFNPLSFPFYEEGREKEKREKEGVLFLISFVPLFFLFLIGEEGEKEKASQKMRGFEIFGHGIHSGGTYLRFFSINFSPYFCKICELLGN